MPPGRRDAPRRRLAALGRHLAPPERGGRCAGGIAVAPIAGSSLGAVVRGVSCAGGDLDDPDAWARVRAAFLEHAVLVFPGQTGMTMGQGPPSPGASGRWPTT